MDQLLSIESTWKVIAQFEGERIANRCRYLKERGLEIMPMPEIDAESRRRPLFYDAKRNKYILFDDIVSLKEKIIPVDSMTEDDLKRLVIMRWRMLPKDTTVQAISGPPLSRDDVIQAIEQDEPFGRDTLEAERSYLRDLLNEIQKNIEK